MRIERGRRICAPREEVFALVTSPGDWASWLGVVGDPLEAAGRVEEGNSYSLTLALERPIPPILVVITALWPGQYIEARLGSDDGEITQQWLFADTAGGSTEVSVITTGPRCREPTARPGRPCGSREIADAVDRILQALADRVGGKTYRP